MKIKITKIRITRSLFCIILFLTIIIFCSKFPSHLNSIKNYCDWLVEESIYKTISPHVFTSWGINEKGDKEQMYENRIKSFKENGVEYDHYEDSILYFTESDEWDYRTTVSDDMKLIGRKVIKKPIILDYLIYESTQFRTKKTNIDSVLIKYHDVLLNRNIEINTPIYVKVESDLYDSILYKNFIEESKIKYNHVTPLFQTGFLDEIFYQFYLYIPFSTVYKSMDKTVLNILYSILLILLIINIYFFIEKYIEKRREKIIDLGNNNFKFGNLIFLHSKQTLHNRKEKYSMYPQTSDILLKLLKDENHSISKPVLLYMLTNTNNVNVNLTRLRNLLAKAGSLYELRHKKESDSYQLELKKVDTGLSPFSDLL